MNSRIVTGFGGGARRTLHAIAISLVILTPVLGSAQPSDAIGPESALTEAERAHQEVDYSAVYTAGLRGLSAGQATVAQTARLNVLVGMAAALLGHDAEARGHFIVALAVQPSLDLEQDLSPRIRGPYMEALGYWRAQGERLGLRIKPEPGSTRLKYQLTDPTHLAATILVHHRQQGATDFTLRSVAAKVRGTVELDAALTRRGFEYYAELADENGNRLFAVGSEDEPIRVAASTDKVAPAIAGADARSQVPAQGSTLASRSRLVPIGMLSAGAVFAAAGVYFNVRREEAAARWNGSECEQPGKTRIQQCGDVDSDRARMQWLAIGAYSAAGAFAVIGTTLWLLPSHSERQSGVALARCSLGVSSLLCDGTF